LGRIFVDTELKRHVVVGINRNCFWKRRCKTFCFGMKPSNGCFEGGYCGKYSKALRCYRRTQRIGDRSLSTNLIHRTRAVKGLQVIWRTSNEMDSKELFVGEHVLVDNLLKGAEICAH